MTQPPTRGSGIEDVEVEGDDVPVAREAGEKVIGGLRVRVTKAVRGGEQGCDAGSVASGAGEKTELEHQEYWYDDEIKVVDDVVEFGSVVFGDDFLHPNESRQRTITCVDGHRCRQPKERLSGVPAGDRDHRKDRNGRTKRGEEVNRPPRSASARTAHGASCLSAWGASEGSKRICTRLPSGSAT